MPFRWIRRLLGRGGPAHRWPVFYHPDYVFTYREDGPRRGYDVRRPQRVAEALDGAGLVRWRDLRTPAPVTWEQLERVHTTAHLQMMKDPVALGRVLHLDHVSPLDSDLFDAFRRMTGGTVAAARTALAEGGLVFNLAGGFHHGKPDRAEGFCPVNDVAVAIRDLQATAPDLRVLVVDLDVHQGNGTALIFGDDPNVRTFSVHGAEWEDCTRCDASTDITLAEGTGDDAYLETLGPRLAAEIEAATPELVVYIAGADPYEGDLLGTLSLTLEGLLERDLRVWRAVRNRGTPMAVVPGGGYGPDAWRIYYRFLEHAFRGEPSP